MTWVQLYLVAVAMVGVGADWGTTRAALGSGWMRETGWVALRLGIPATVLLRLSAAVLLAALVPVDPWPPAAALGCWGIGLVSFRVASGNVRRLWRQA